MFPRIARFRSATALRAHLETLGIAADLPLDEAVLPAAEGSPLAAPIRLGGREVGNRFCIHPMEGWDATADGLPTEPLLRRWRHFGASGAKLIWGGEAVAVLPEGRANPNQLLAPALGREGLTLLNGTIVEAHRERFGRTDDLLVALQLTHSGRFSRPSAAGRQPLVAFHHPLLDRRYGVDPEDASCVLADRDIDAVVEAYVAAARDAAAAGFGMVDIKCCHGYLLNEFLAARRRPGRYGGDFTGRSRLLVEIVERVREGCAELLVGVRLSLFDTVPWELVNGEGRPCGFDPTEPFDAVFGVDAADPTRIDLEEPIRLLGLLREYGVAAVNLSAGCPYATPHLLRPAAFPPSDGYPPPEDPLVGVARQVAAAREAKRAVPGLPMVGSGYSYLQDYLVHAAQASVRAGWIDLVGLGRMVLSYPELPADALAGRPVERRRICRTFSDCTTAPRNGLRSGCYPLDAFYKGLEPDAGAMLRLKASAETG
jgi:2,4-dienoyl-CoA reductase-like NADH-dependent reductase (Old Yellow Enzyme family)